MKRILMILVVMLALPAVAHAQPASTAAGDLPIAEAYWGGPPPGCSSVTFGTTPLPTNGGEATQPSPGEVVACRIMVHEIEPATGYTPEKVCEIAVHEMGHLHGMGHVDDPANIMYFGPVTPGIVPACVDTRQAEEDAAYEAWVTKKQAKEEAREQRVWERHQREKKARRHSRHK